MSHQYAGNPAAYPVDFQCPDDGENKTASAYNVAYEALADRTAWLKAHSPRVQAVTYTATGTIVVPDRCVAILANGYGGGGAGGKGGAPAIGTGRTGSGGSGGGGAVQSEYEPIAVTPGETLDVIVGAGGTGLDVNNNGAPGGDSKIQRAGADLAIFYGAGGGVAGDLTTAVGIFAYCSPGLPVRPGAGGTGTTDYAITGGRTTTASSDILTLAGLMSRPFGAGGCGFGATTMNQGGMRNARGSGYGGAPGTAGATVSSYIGGGGGGGGGAGPGGNGGAGGNGPPGSTSGGNTGSFGTAAAANTGAGGGGGGGAGGGNTSVSTGGTGGAGGSGKITIFYVLET